MFSVTLNKNGLVFLLAVFGFFGFASACGTLEDVNNGNGDGDATSGLVGWGAAVMNVTYGIDAGFGQGLMPLIVLGPPVAGEADIGSLDVVSLGVGGSITLSFGPNHCVVDAREMT